MECLSVTARTCFKKQENGLSEKPHEIERKKMQVIYLRTVIKLFRLLKIFFSLYFQCGTWCYRQASVTWLDVATYSSQRRKLAQIWRQCVPHSPAASTASLHHYYSACLERKTLSLWPLCSASALSWRLFRQSVPRVTPVQRSSAFPEPVS